MIACAYRARNPRLTIDMDDAMLNVRAFNLLLEKVNARLELLLVCPITDMLLVQQKIFRALRIRTQKAFIW